MGLSLGVEVFQLRLLSQDRSPAICVVGLVYLHFLLCLAWKVSSGISAVNANIEHKEPITAKTKNISREVVAV